MAGFGFPVGYQSYQQQYGMYPSQMSGASQQYMSPPTIHAEIIQVSGRDEAAGWPVGAGQSQMMMAKDDSAIYIKNVYANGQAQLTEYQRHVPEQEPAPDYVTRAELEERLAEIMRPKRAKKEAADGTDV